MEINIEWAEKWKRCFNLPQDKKIKSNVLKYKKDYTGLHPTQKPLALIEDIVSTYSNVKNTVLDFTMGSGTTGAACMNTDRKFIGIELDKTYFDTACRRIQSMFDQKNEQNSPILT